MKPLLLLDIDGVIAPFGGTHADEHEAVETDEQRSQLSHKRIEMPPYSDLFVRHDLPQVMKRLMQHFDLMWGTAWGGSEANKIMLEHLGLENPLPAIDYGARIPGRVIMKMSGPQWIDKDSEAPDFWKMIWIEDFAEESGKPFVFIDDEITSGAIEWAKQRTADGIPTLMVKTDNAIGWTDHHEAELIAWTKEIDGDQAKG